MSSGDFTTSKVPRCYETHLALPIGKYKIYGGSASWPVVDDADVYVSLQAGSTCGCISDPWDEHKVIEVQFSITDGCAPKDPARFKKLIDWICNQLQEGKKIHVGCIGGHGRTGMVLAAIVSQMTDEKDAIKYVRKHYCHKVVETHSQIAFLEKHYGVKTASPSKTVYVQPEWEGNYAKNGFIPAKKKSQSSFGFADRVDDFKERMEKFETTYEQKKKIPAMAKGSKTIRPVASTRSLWKSPKEIK